MLTARQYPKILDIYEYYDLNIFSHLFNLHSFWVLCDCGSHCAANNLNKWNLKRWSYSLLILTQPQPPTTRHAITPYSIFYYFQIRQLWLPPIFLELDALKIPFSFTPSPPKYPWDLMLWTRFCDLFLFSRAHTLLYTVAHTPYSIFSHPSWNMFSQEDTKIFHSHIITAFLKTDKSCFSNHVFNISCIIS